MSVSSTAHTNELQQQQRRQRKRTKLKITHIARMRSRRHRRRRCLCVLTRSRSHRLDLQSQKKRENEKNSFLFVVVFRFCLTSFLYIFRLICCCLFNVVFCSSYFISRSYALAVRICGCVTGFMQTSRTVRVRAADAYNKRKIIFVFVLCCV